MKYPTGEMIKIGDRVIVDGMEGVVVCDFDSREFLAGFGDWDMPDVEMLGGGKLDSGAMIKTVEAGLIHYREGCAWSLQKR